MSKSPEGHWPAGHDDRPPSLGLVAAALDHQLLVADPDPRAVVQRRRTVDALPVEPGAVARAGVLEGHLALAVATDGDARLATRHARVIELQSATRGTANGHLAQHRNPRAVREHQFKLTGHQDSQHALGGVLNNVGRSIERRRLLKPSQQAGRSRFRMSAPTIEAAPTTAAPRATSRVSPWWWRPRVRSALLIGVLALITVLARIVAQLQTDWLWFHELGQENVFWTMVANRWLAGGLAGLGTTMFLLANLWFVERVAPDSAPPRRALMLVYLALSAGAGFLVGRHVVVVDWQEIVLWLHRSDFGVTDPLFHRDVSFFVFSLPLYQKIGQWLFLTVALALVSTFAAHAATGAIRMKPAPVSANRGAHIHVLGLGTLLLLITAWRHWLSEFALELPRAGAKLPGRRLHRRERPASVAPGTRDRLARRRGHAPLRSPEAVVGAPRRRACAGGIRRTRQPGHPAVGRRALLRRPSDPVAGASLHRRLDQVHPARVRTPPCRRSPTAGERPDLRSRVAGEQGRPRQRPALGHRCPEAADRPAAVDRLVLRVPRQHGRPLPPRWSRAGNDRRPAGARSASARAVGPHLG